MKTNDLKKGTEVILRNGWSARIEDNMKGNTRLCTVRGLVTEMGSVYSHDIMVLAATGEQIEHTPAQVALMARVHLMGM